MNNTEIEFGPWKVWLKGWGSQWFTAVYSALSNTFIVNGPTNFQTNWKPEDIIKKEFI